MNRLERIYAFLFADGCVANPNSNHPEWRGSNCVMAFCHGPKQEEYVKWKQNELEELGFEARFVKKDVLYRKAGSIHNGKHYISCQVKTKSHYTFTKARSIAYVNNMKTYHKGWVNEDTVDDYALAVWWMDDGDFSGTLNCNCNEEEAILLKDLFEKILKGKVSIHNKKGKKNIYFPVITKAILFSRIYKFIHPTMLYKCSVGVGEDGKPIIPNSAEQLLLQCEQKLKI
jgi:hypothetical protein